MTILNLSHFDFDSEDIVANSFKSLAIANAFELGEVFRIKGKTEVLTLCECICPLKPLSRRINDKIDGGMPRIWQT